MSYDCIITGSTPDALVAAAYIARAGQKVLVLEKSAQAGGVFSSREFAGGFKADAAFTSGSLERCIISELELEKHGLEIIERNTITGLLAGGKSITLDKNRKTASKEISKLSEKDAAAYEKFMNLLDQAADFLSFMYASPAPEPQHPDSEDSGLLQALSTKLQSYGRREMSEILRLFLMSSRDLLNEHFESAELKGLLAGPSIKGLNLGPFSASTTFNLLHHLAIGDAYFRTYAKGGLAAFTMALEKAAIKNGAELRLSSPVKKILLEDGVAKGVLLEGGEQIKSEIVISSHDPGYLYRTLIDPPELDPEFNRALSHVRYNGVVARVDLALKKLPAFKCDLKEEFLKGTILISPDLAYLEKTHDCAKYGKLSSNPYIELTVPSLVDPELAPEGKHLLSLWLQYAPYKLNQAPEKILETALSTLSEYISDLPAQVIESRVQTARSFESEFNLTEGHLYGGDMSLTQSFYLRPLCGFAKYASPIESLYLCGPATYPGGGLSGLSGRNLAELLKARKAELVVC